MAPQIFIFFQKSPKNYSYDGLWSKMPLGSLQEPAKSLPRASQEPPKSRPRALKKPSTAFKSLLLGPQEDSKSLLCDLWVQICNFLGLTKNRSQTLKFNTFFDYFWAPLSNSNFGSKFAIFLGFAKNWSQTIEFDIFFDRFWAPPPNSNFGSKFAIS